VPTTMKLRVDKFDELCRQRSWATDAERARGLDLDPATISRVCAGTQRPGARFISACLDEFGALAYDLLFERVDEQQESNR
jgi:hypothetical protein